MKKKTTKKALVLSLLSLLLCCSMLVGTTFAWFTDSVTSGKNRIVAGNLDVELEYWNGTKWEKVAENTNVFEEDTLWEPGHTEVVYLKVSNQGTLALKYKLGINIADETGSVSVNGKDFKLSEFIQVGIVKGLDETKLFDSREDARNAQFEQNKLIKEGYVTESQLYAANNVPTDGKTAEYVAMVVYMPETVDNSANYMTGEAAPKILLGLDLQATQVNFEEDSFDSTYDINAEYKANNNSPSAPSFFVGSAADLAAALTPTVSNDEVKVTLTQDIELTDGETWTPLNLNAYDGNVRNVVIDGQGHTIKGLNAPLIAQAHFGNTSIEIKNLTLTGCKIEQAGYNGLGLGAFVGAADATAPIVFDNCHLTDSTITCTNDVSGVGGIIGYSSSSLLTMTNCSVTNTKVNGSKDSVGAIVGHTYQATITNAKVVGCTLKGETAEKTGYVVGSVTADTTITTSADCANNTVFDVADSTAVYGRIVGATLILNGVTLP